MTRISARSVWFQKKVIPVIWFGVLAAFLLTVVQAVVFGEPSGPWPLFLIMPLVMAAGGYVMMKK